MEAIRRLAAGRHTSTEIRLHLAALAIVYWGLVICAWLGYPAERHYSVTTQMLSALGSFDERHNPQWFWVFTIAMVYCGVAMMPIMLYIRRRFVAVSYWGAQAGTFLFMVGSAGIALTGLFPYARGEVIGHWEWKHLHMNAAALITLGFSFGILWHGILLLKDKSTTKALASNGKFPYLKFIGPYLVCAPVFCAIGYRIRWHEIGALIAGSADASGRSLGGAMLRALNGLHGFALLEHLAIWALTIYVIWFTVLLPYETNVPASGLPVEGDAL